MKKTTALVAALAVCAGAALAAPPSKIKEFLPANAGEAENADADGICMIKYNESTNYTSFHMVIHGLKPNTSYGIQLNSDDTEPNSVSGFTAPVAFKTNHQGKGMYDVQLPFNMSVNPVVLIFIWDEAMVPYVDPFTGEPVIDPATGQPYMVPDVDAVEIVTDQELRAVGVAS